MDGSQTQVYSRINKPPAIRGDRSPSERQQRPPGRPRFVPPEYQGHGSDSSAEARKTGVNAIKAINVQFTKSTAMRDALSPSGVEFALQEDISND